MHLRGKGKKKTLCPGGWGEQTHRNTGNLSIKGKDRATFSTPITHIMRSAVGGIGTLTSHVTHGSVTSPPKCGNDRYLPHLLICTVLGLKPRPSETQAFVLVRQTLSIELPLWCRIFDLTQPLHGTFPVP